MQAWLLLPGAVLTEGGGVLVDIPSLVGTDLRFMVVIMKGWKPCTPQPYRPEAQPPVKDIAAHYKSVLSGKKGRSL